MSRFLALHDRLDTRDLGEGRVQLLAPLHYQSDLLGGRTIRVPAGFVCDMESVPRWLPLAYALFARTANRAGILHDWLYQTHKVEDLEVSRTLADAVYYEANALDTYGNPGRWIKWLGVRIGGGRSYANGPARLRARNDRRRLTRVPLSPEERRRLEALARQSAAERAPTTKPRHMTTDRGRPPDPPQEAP